MDAALVAMMTGGALQVVTNLPTLIVTARQADTVDWVVPAATPAHTLAADPRMSLRAQGGPGAQCDFSIRGSAFSEAGWMLESLALRSPQTEHFNAELPIPPDWLTAPRVVTGPDQVRAGDGHAVGSVAVGLRPLDPAGRIRVDALAGEAERAALALTAEHPAGEFVAGAFGMTERADALDEPDNALERAGAGARLHGGWAGGRIDLLLAHQTKTFGARGYYGVDPALAAEEELDDTLALAVAAWDGARSRIRATAAWRSLDDTYRLDTATGPYVNDHRSTIGAAQVQGRHTGHDAWGLIWQAVTDVETLESARLGNRERSRAAVLVLPDWTAASVRIAAGARLEAFSDESPAVLPQASARLDVGHGHALHVALTDSVRRPSYTELNYESPGSLGNAGLEREAAREIEAGWRWRPRLPITAAVHAFLRRTRNTVDWVRATEADTQWAATDIGTVETRGIEMQARAAPSAALRAGVAYTALDKRDAVAVYAGRYVLDYPEHRAVADVTWDLGKRISLSVSQAWQRQTVNPVRTSAREAWTGLIALRIVPPRCDNTMLTLAAENVWNDAFQVLPGQRAPGRRAWAGLTAAW
jgi:vitamin B12 transporter